MCDMEKSIQLTIHGLMNVSHILEKNMFLVLNTLNTEIFYLLLREKAEDIAKSVAYVGHDKCLVWRYCCNETRTESKISCYVLNTTMAREQKSRGKVKSKVVHSNVPSIEQIEIPFLLLEVQKRYADVLDNFEQICNDLNIGLQRN